MFSSMMKITNNRNERCPPRESGKKVRYTTVYFYFTVSIRYEEPEEHQNNKGLDIL